MESRAMNIRVHTGNHRATLKQMLGLTKLTPFRHEKTPGRNDPCPCGSGKKAKACHLREIKFLAGLPANAREAVIASTILSRPQP